MLFSRNWLAEYVDLPADPQEIARRLTAAGLNVEGVEEKGATAPARTSTSPPTGRTA